MISIISKAPLKRYLGDQGIASASTDRVPRDWVCLPIAVKFQTQPELSVL
jgi:hypothetical protein